jgi:hypothetical protein
VIGASRADQPFELRGSIAGDAEPTRMYGPASRAETIAEFEAIKARMIGHGFRARKAAMSGTLSCCEIVNPCNRNIEAVYWIAPVEAAKESR